MIGKSAIDFREEVNHITTDVAQQLWSNTAADTIATVDHYPERPLQRNIIDHPLAVGRPDVFAALRTGAVGESILFYPAPQALNSVARKRVAGDHDLEAIVLRGIVAARDRDRRTDAKMVGGEVGQWCRHHTDINHVTARDTNAAGQRSGHLRTRQTTISADDNRAVSRVQRFAADSSADRLDDRCRQRLTNDTADIVGFEDLWGQWRHIGFLVFSNGQAV